MSTARRHWAGGLATAAATVAPFVTSASLAARSVIACLNLVLGVAIGSLVAGTARGATRVHPSEMSRDAGY